MTYKIGDRVWVLLMLSKNPEKVTISEAYREGCYLKPYGLYIGYERVLGYVDP